MSLARTSPKKPANKPARPRASPRWPTEWPREDSPAFRKLPPEEQAWVRHAHPWYVLCTTMGSASVMVRVPIFERVRENQEQYLPFLVKYFLVSPRIFGFALYALTGADVSQAHSIRAQHKAWKDWLKERSAPARHAAE